MSEMNLTGKVALVTGASQGIGRAIARELAANGANLVVTARNQDKLEELAGAMRELGRTVKVVAGDLRDEQFPDVLVAAAQETFGRLDILVNSAGATKRGNFRELSNADWIDGFALKFFGAAWLTRAAWPHLAKESGSLVMITGAGGRTPDIHFSIGGPVNAALLSLTKVLAELGLKDGVQVNSVNPGIIRTERLDKRLRVTSRELGISEASAAERILQDSRIARIGEPEDVAALVAFIVSPRGRLLHGTLIDIDAGMTKSL